MDLFISVLTVFFSVLFCLLGMIPAPIADKITRILASLWFRIDDKHRHIAIQNLTRALGHEKNKHEIHSLALQAFENMFRILFEVGWSLYVKPAELERSIYIQNPQHIQQALTKGKGILVLTAHIGSWELMAIVSRMLRIPTQVLFRPLDFKPLDIFFRQFRTRFGASLIPTAHSMRKILRSLKNGEAIVFLMDQNVDWYEGVFVDFFGHTACTNKGLALLALKTQAPVIPFFFLRGRNRFIAEFGEEIPLIQTGDRTHDIEANTLQYNQAIEAVIRRYPDQWFWIHQRWKTQPSCPWPKL